MKGDSMSNDRGRGVPPRRDRQILSKNAAGRRIYEKAERQIGYFCPEEPVAKVAGNLPHWRQEAVTYFVTFRLADSLPEAKLKAWKRERDSWVAARPKPWNDAIRDAYHRQFTAVIEKWLDAGHGSCLLARKDVRAVVCSALRHFADVRYTLDAWIVMPTHVHAVLTPLADYELSSILHTWKSFTSHAVRRILPEWSGPLWQKESFDHIVRGPDHLERIRAYIAQNPLGLPPDSYTLSSTAQES